MEVAFGDTCGPRYRQLEMATSRATSIPLQPRGSRTRKAFSGTTWCFDRPSSTRGRFVVIWAARPARARRRGRAGTRRRAMRDGDDQPHTPATASREASTQITGNSGGDDQHVHQGVRVGVVEIAGEDHHAAVTPRVPVLARDVPGLDPSGAGRQRRTELCAQDRAALRIRSREQHRRGRGAGSRPRSATSRSASSARLGPCPARSSADGACSPRLEHTQHRGVSAARGESSVRRSGSSREDLRDRESSVGQGRGREGGRRPARLDVFTSAERRSADSAAKPRSGQDQPCGENAQGDHRGTPLALCWASDFGGCAS